VCARAGAGSRRIVLRWGARVVGGLWRRGEGAVAWCLLTPSSRAAARKRVLGRLHEVFSRTNRGIRKNGAREPSPNLSPPGSLAQKNLTEWFGGYRPATAGFWMVSLDTFLSCASVCAAAAGCGHRSRRTSRLRGRRREGPREALVCLEAITNTRGSLLLQRSL